MALVYNSNVNSLRALRSLSDTVRSTAEVFERLSSGMRINHASDDAAGLAVATGLSSRSRVYTQALRNGNDVLSLLNVAQGATEDLSGIATRLKELASQAANGTLTLTQRRSLNTESDALTGEFNRLISSTRFNNLNILTADSGQIVSQLGFGTSETISATSADGLRRSTGAATYASAVLTGVNGIVDSAVGDFNGDGFLDVAGISGAGGIMQVALGNGNGSFKVSQVTITASGGNLTRIAAGDFDNNGKVDLAVADSLGHVYTYKDSGGIGTMTLIADNDVGGAAIYNLEAADLNGDQKIDIVAGVNGTTLYSALGNGNGTFQDESSFSAAASMSTTAVLQLADFNGDGIVDLFAPAAVAFSNSTVFFGTGNGAFSQKAALVAGGGTNITVGDFNRDGMDDFITAAGNLYNSNGDGTFSSSSVGSFGTGILKSGDMNGDGYADIVAMGTLSTLTYLGNGNGTFQAGVTTTTATAVTGNVGDFNGDGALDIALGIAGNIAVYAANTSQSTTIQHLDLNGQTSAREALTVLDGVLDRISKNLGGLGASMSRIGSALETLSATRDNYESARSRIVDTDVASDAALLVRNQVRQQASTAILAQANQQPSLALQLLDGI